MPETTAPQAIFFDAAGTLIHVAEPVGKTYARIAAEHGVIADATELEATFRRTWKMLPQPFHPEDAPAADDDRAWWHELVRRTFADVVGEKIAPLIFTALFSDLYAYFADASAWRLYDDTVPALRQLHSRCKLLVVSNFDRRLRRVLAGLGIEDFFTHIILSSEVGVGKPHERMFRAAVDACGHEASHCVHVGDESRADDEGARAAGLHSFLLDRPQVTLMTLAENVMRGTHSGLQRTPK